MIYLQKQIAQNVNVSTKLFRIYLINLKIVKDNTCPTVSPAALTLYILIWILVPYVTRAMYAYFVVILFHFR